jgi:PAS domain-containing protein
MILLPTVPCGTLASPLSGGTGLNGLWLGFAGVAGAGLMAVLWWRERRGNLGLQAERRELTRGFEALREDHQRLSTIINHVDAYLFIKDAGYRYTFVSPKVCALFRLPAEAILGQTDEALYPPRISTRSFRKRTGPCSSGGKPAPGKWSCRGRTASAEPSGR